MAWQQIQFPKVMLQYAFTNTAVSSSISCHAWHNDLQSYTKGTFIHTNSCVPAIERTVVAGAILQSICTESFMCCRWVVDRLGANLQKELDFRFEAENATRFAMCMAKNPYVAAPHLVPEVSAFAEVIDVSSLAFCRSSYSWFWNQGSTLRRRRHVFVHYVVCQDSVLTV